MAQTFTVAGAASLPFEDGTNVAPISLALAIPYTGRADFQRTYSGGVTNDPVDFGTLEMVGAKGVLVKCTLGTCTIKFQDSTTGTAFPLAVGGFFLWSNPTIPFPTSAFITTTAAAAVLFIAVG